ncbi:MAG: 16S rRNA methyltransferase [Myxococcota bacterium]
MGSKSLDAAAALDEVVRAVAASKRYRSVHEATVRRIATEQLAAAGGRGPEAIKRTKRALHQIFGAYLPRPPRYARLLERLTGADSEAERREALRQAMAQHASTRERLDHLEPFYERLREHVGTPGSVLDLACGLGPLASPWLGLSGGASYHAWDIDVAMVEFVGQCLSHLGLTAEAGAVDLLDVPAWPQTDVALVLKTLPCLEQQHAGSSDTLLAAIPAPTLVVSFPTRSLSGRAKGMHATYARGFEALLAARGWEAESFEVGPELVYVVKR